MATRGRFGRWLRWVLAPPIAVCELRRGDRVILRYDDRTHTVESVRRVSWSTENEKLFEVVLRRPSGAQRRLYLSDNTILRRVSAS